MSEKLVKIWNASNGIVKFGPNNEILYPAQSAVIPARDAVGTLFNEKRVVIIEEIVESQPAESPKRKKKEVVEVVEESVEIPSEEDNSSVANIESTEDSILPE